MREYFRWASCWKNGQIDRKAECDKLFTYSPKDKDGNILYQVSVVKSSMVGSIYYAALNVGHGIVKAVVAKTSVKDISKIIIKSFYESEEKLDKFDCPKSILKLLTPPRDEISKRWRERCLGEAQL